MDTAQSAMKIIRLPAQPTLDEIEHGLVAGVDNEPGETPYPRPWYEPQNAAEVDALVWGCEVRSTGLQASLARLKAELAAVQTRQGRIIERYSDLLQAEAHCPPDKQYKTWRGPFSGGTYRNQPGRLPEIKLADKSAALAAGLAREKVSVEADTAAIRAAEPGYCQRHGVELLPQPAISFSAAKGE